MHRVGLRLDAQVVVPRVVPAALVQPRHRLARREARERRRPLQVAVEVIVVDRGHARVVEVTRGVPDAVALVHADVAHLDRQEVLERRLPHVARVDVRADTEGIRARLAVAHDVHPWLLDPAEVEAQVAVAQEAAPVGGRGLHRGLEGALRGHARDDHRPPCGVARVRLDDRPLLLLRVVADLRDLDDGIGHEARQRVRRDEPAHRTLRRPLRDERAHDEPAVVVLTAAVDELESAARLVGNRQPLGVHLGRDHEPLAGGERRDLVVARCVEAAGAVRLAWEDAGGRLGLEGAAEEQPGEQLHVEPDLADPLVGQRLLEVDDEAKGLADRPHADRVREPQIGVVDGVEALAVLRLVRVLRAQADLASGAVHDPLADLGHRLPLPRRAVEADVAVRRDAPPVLDDSDPALVALGVVVVREHHVEPRHRQVLEVVELQRGGRGPGRHPGHRGLRPRRRVGGLGLRRRRGQRPARARRRRRGRARRRIGGARRASWRRSPHRRTASSERLVTRRRGRRPLTGRPWSIQTKPTPARDAAAPSVAGSSPT